MKKRLGFGLTCDSGENGLVENEKPKNFKCTLRKIRNHSSDFILFSKTFIRSGGGFQFLPKIINLREVITIFSKNDLFLRKN